MNDDLPPHTLRDAVAAIEPRSLDGRAAAVEARGAMAIIVPAGWRADALADAAVRSRLLSAARSSGFTHVAVEILPHDAPDRAPRLLPGGGNDAAR